MSAQEMDDLRQRSTQLAEQLQRKSEEVLQKKKGVSAEQRRDACMPLLAQGRVLAIKDGTAFWRAVRRHWQGSCDAGPGLEGLHAHVHVRVVHAQPCKTWSAR